MASKYFKNSLGLIQGEVSSPMFLLYVNMISAEILKIPLQEKWFNDRKHIKGVEKL